MRYAQPVESGFSPLDEELQLLPGTLTPLMAEGVVRLGAWLPFGQGSAEMAYFLHLTVSDSTTRRATERAGAAYVEVQTAEVERLERELPPAPEGVDKQLLSVDGAFVPLVDGSWTEVKTLTLGEIQSAALPATEGVPTEVHTTNHSYFSRMSAASEFTRLALVETYRRGVTRSAQVCAVVDGAEWNQHFIAWHRADAKRILDFMHAAEYLADAGHAVYGEDTSEFQTWFAGQRRELKDGEPDRVLQELRGLSQSPATPLAQTARAIIQTSLDYLQQRRDQIDYARFQQAGYPIGSGAGEACHRYVIEARLKGTGMRWAPDHVNPMAALRNVVCNNRWEEGWAQIATHLRHSHPHAAAATPPPPPKLPLAAESTSTPRLPPDFKLRPGVSWHDRPVGKARYSPSAERFIAKR